MNKTFYYLIAGVIILIAGLVASKDSPDPTILPVSKDKKLPETLDNYYPPKAQGPVFLFNMHEMGKPFTGIVVDLFENDMENAKINFKHFKDKYTEISKMVPEWKEYFPQNPLDELDLAMGKEDPQLIMQAHEKVGKVCGNCHFANMPAVQFKYHWADFSDITVADPVTKEEINFSRLMQYLDANLTGVQINVEQDQVENAKRQLSALNERFAALEEACAHCHDTDRYYYVDQRVKTMLSDLEKALAATPVDQTLLARSSQGIGMESCYKCHLVHVPAAAAQFQAK